MPPPVSSNPANTNGQRVRRSLQLAVFIVSLLWFGLAQGLAARAARGITDHFNIDDARPLLAALFLVFLLVTGFTFFAGVSKTGRGSMRTVLGLPRRATAGREWALGTALGWGMAVAAVLPMALAGAMHVRFWTDQRAFNLLALHFGTLMFTTLASEVVLRGFAFQRLIAFAGAARATAIMAILLGIAHGLNPEATWITILATVTGSVLLSLAWLRTHALWLPWGLHLAWSASLGLLFGLPVRGVSSFASVIQVRTIGPTWLTGYDFGVEGALFTTVVLIAGIVVLMLTTNDYAWAYTRPQIIAAGYEVNPEPPAAHVAMETAAVRAPALVQILPTTSESRSVDDHPGR